MNTIAALAGRILLSLLFIISGLGKLFDVSSAQVALAGVGLSPDLALPAGLFELIGGLALMFGVATRIFAVLLAGFTLLTILFFHHNLLDHTGGRSAQEPRHCRWPARAVRPSPGGVEL
jgi:putative oxidoreductase